MAGTFSGARLGDTHAAAPRDGVTTMRWPGLPGRLARWRTLADIDGGRNADPPPRRTRVNPRCGENTSRLDTESSSIGQSVDDFSAGQIRNGTGHCGGPVAGHKGSHLPELHQRGRTFPVGRGNGGPKFFCVIPCAVAWSPNTMSIVGVFTMPVARRQTAWCAVALSGRLTAERDEGATRARQPDRRGPQCYRDDLPPRAGAADPVPDVDHAAKVRLTANRKREVWTDDPHGPGRSPGTGRNSPPHPTSLFPDVTTTSTPRRKQFVDCRSPP